MKMKIQKYGFYSPKKEPTPFIPSRIQNCHCLLLAIKKKKKSKEYFTEISEESKSKCVNKTL